jgi:hypothetical protein
MKRPENRDYYRGPHQVQRVQAWRKTHPGYWKKRRRKAQGALPDDCSAQVAIPQADTARLTGVALPDDWFSQPAVVVGLVAGLTGSALPDEIAHSLRKFQAHGQIILGMGPGMKPKRGSGHAVQKSVVSGTAAAGAGAF